VTDEDVAALLEAQRRSYERAGDGLRRSWPPERALGPDELRSILADLVYGVLATARPDGRAHASPVAFSVAAGAFWIATVRGVRLRNLRAVPWASFVLSEGQREGAHRALTAEGPVRLHENADFGSARARLDEDWARRHGHPPDWASAFVELRPERVFSHRSR
jgi:nitroimidazol reductase NimA-like FMN-containing flavoprotein (pyridoxamine 5'-phosphate oxidase superfamily)